MEYEQVLYRQLAKLKAEHRSLDIRIEHIMLSNMVDQLTIQRLKKQKLQLRDRITRIESELLPDIIA